MDAGLRQGLALRAALLAGVLVAATAFFHAYEGAPWGEALYFVAMVLTLVGSNYTPTTPLGTAVAIALAFVSVGVILSIVGQVFGPQLAGILRRRSRLSIAAHRKDHVIVIGATDTALEIAERLRERAVLVVATEAEYDAADRRGLAVLLGDAARAATLREAGVEGARMLVAANDDDADNAFACLTAKRVRPSLRVVVRISREENREKMQAVGADDIVCPPTLAAERILREAGSA